ncbi:hypothetical protein Fleli_3639 [Bernardetia litoralis DSM 6794]|uniref:Uncharacterized protein n=1 Tax=Bernardetia litoralis (strain ATCC 23117 / DSM 6794 / NBRC 15988 / NCIMB 1366 / Fx l1 / Sio-4) TaxID=880071 RepID=I4APS0_BERLS|nr:hypothetical protein [Bernardetia litoralis]AFM05955.1 hypothetical protein Fleli_3639 [Bernardetia litoralis DSM 6794]
MFKKTLSFILQISLIVLLTVFTQIGGAVWLIVWLQANFLCFKIKKKSYSTYLKIKLSLFFGFYLFATFVIVPLAAKHYNNRVALPVFVENNIQPTTIWTCILNRHYVKPKLKEALFRIGNNFEKKYPNSKVNYLDANFPFSLALYKNKGFPLLPHLSHNDGKKIDLSFFYLNKETQEPTNKKPSFSGYGIYEAPKQEEYNQPEICLKQSWYYEIGKYAKVYSNEEDYSFDKERTNYLITLVIKEHSIKKFFLEPHLKNRFKVSSSKWRFHGCKASRHDDHVHVQL